MVESGSNFSDINSFVGLFYFKLGEWFMEITLNFDLNEVNMLLQVLADAPFKIAEPLITKIRTQASEQVNTAQTAANLPPR